MCYCPNGGEFNDVNNSQLCKLHIDEMWESK